MEVALVAEILTEVALVLTEVALVAEVLQQYHSNPMGGHSGVNNTLSKISQCYSWSGMKEDVTDYVSSTTVEHIIGYNEI